MAQATQCMIPATYMRGGTSKGVFFNLKDLPETVQLPGKARDSFFLRVIGSPDPYGKQIDGMGGATSSTSKVVILSKSVMGDHDVDYLFGQVSINKPQIDWSGNCGNLTASVGTFAINSGLIDKARIPVNGTAKVKIWQANIKKTIIVYVPITDGRVKETGDFVLDGVAFPAAEVKVEFVKPAESEMLFPTGHLTDVIEVPEMGRFKSTLIDAGIPTIFINAEDLGYEGTELQDDINKDHQALARLETIRAYGALKMGLINCVDDPNYRQHTPKLAFVSKPKSYCSASGAQVSYKDIDLLSRAMSMGKLHHAMMGTVAVSIGAAASIPGTLVNLAAGGGLRDSVCFGHPSGTLKVGADVLCDRGHWSVNKVTMSRSARTLMQGRVFVPDESLW